MKCRNRVLAALKHTELSPQELANSLFVTRATIRIVLGDLFNSGLLYRKFFHNKKTNRPDYRYCCVAYPARHRMLSADDCVKQLVAKNLVGDFDTRHVRFRKLDAA